MYSSTHQIDRIMNFGFSIEIQGLRLRRLLSMFHISLILERLTLAIKSSFFVEMLTLAIIRWDEANKEKVRLEEKQRGVRKKREQEAELAAQVHFYNSLMKFEQTHKSNIYNSIFRRDELLTQLSLIGSSLCQIPTMATK